MIASLDLERLWKSFCGYKETLSALLRSLFVQVSSLWQLLCNPLSYHRTSVFTTVKKQSNRSQKLTMFSQFSSVQFSPVTQSCPTVWDPMNRSTPGLPVHHQLQEFTQTHIHHVGDAIQPSHPLSSPSPPAPNPSQHQSLFQWVNSSREVAKVLEFQL